MKGIFRKGIWIFGILVILIISAYFLLNGLSTYREMKRLRVDSIWRLPSRVYSSELVMTQGMDIERAGLLDRLTRLRYREVADVSAPGEFSRDPQGITVFFHSFQFLGKKHDALPVRLSIDDGQITRIVRTDRNEQIESASLEPECITEIFDSLYEDRTIVDLDDCPRHLLEAIITTEDKRFYDHRASISGLCCARDHQPHPRRHRRGLHHYQQLIKNLFSRASAPCRARSERSGWH